MKKILYTMMAFAIATFALTSCEDVPCPYDIPGIGGDDDPDPAVDVEPLGSGTLADPYNVAAANNACAALQQSSSSASYYSDSVYVKGIVYAVNDTAISSYGNLTYYISDDGTSTNKLEVYRGYGLGGAKFTSLSDLNVGDTVIVGGKLQNWLGTYEFTSGAKLFYLNGKTPEASQPASTTVTEVTCANASELALALEDKSTSTETYAVTGYITSIQGNVSKGQQSFWMADTKDGGKVFEAYYANLPEGVSEFVVGSKVKITGSLMRYGSIAEMKNATVVILEQGSGSEDGSEDKPATTTEGGLNIDGSTVTLTNSAMTAGTSSVTIDLNSLSLDNAAVVSTVDLSDGGTIVFDKGSNTNAPKFYTATNGVRVYAGCTITFNGMSNIAKIVMTCDSYNGTDYVGQTTATVSFNGKTAVYTNAGSATTQLRVQTITIYYANSSSAKRFRVRK